MEIHDLIVVTFLWMLGLFQLRNFVRGNLVYSLVQSTPRDVIDRACKMIDEQELNGGQEEIDFLNEFTRKMFSLLALSIFELIICTYILFLKQAVVVRYLAFFLLLKNNIMVLVVRNWVTKKSENLIVGISEVPVWLKKLDRISTFASAVSLLFIVYIFISPLLG